MSIGRLLTHTTKKGHVDVGQHNAVLNDVALLEATPCEGISTAIKLHFKRLLGEAVARSLEHDYPGAKKMLSSAERYIQARSQEISRFWYLSACGATVFPFLMYLIVFWVFRDGLISAFGVTVFWCVLSSSAGALGALLSVIGRAGKQTFDCSAGRKLHYLEGASRVVAGAISGALIGLAVHSDLILSALSVGGRMSALMIMAAFAGGYSERLATSLISNISAAGAKISNGPHEREAADAQSIDHCKPR